MTNQTPQPEETVERTVRHAAGADPQKRQQIMAGAKRVFMECGFDAASVNDICHGAGISKSTLYVYFENKEELFEAIIENERDRLFEGVADVLASESAPADVLHQFGVTIASIICSDSVVRAQRIIIGIAERMPALGARFYSGGAMRAQTALTGFLDRKVAMGELAIADTSLAAAQFIELSTVALWKPRLFGKAAAPPSPEQIDASVTSAVALFVCAYAPKSA
ncbi:TetR/AcrR family transcriptional regulator [Celeribacter sp.]|uniref:TetR/AcrR family transcriptional regulator n=1 Tax=Celeribacter sp. TaxID=1890673 RepID=UPI003A935E9F